MTSWLGNSNRRVQMWLLYHCLQWSWKCKGSGLWGSLRGGLSWQFMVRGADEYIEKFNFCLSFFLSFFLSLIIFLSPSICLSVCLSVTAYVAFVLKSMYSLPSCATQPPWPFIWVQRPPFSHRWMCSSERAGMAVTSPGTAEKQTKPPTPLRKLAQAPPIGHKHYRVRSTNSLKS